jgi:CRISPR-associated protein Cmr1
MQEVTFTLQTITPMFLAGADYKSISIPPKRQQGKRTYATQGWDLQAEIRSSSFRGLMRYWQRTAINGLGDNFRDIMHFEQSIFGTTDQGSAINVRIANISKKAERFEKDKESFSQENITGRDYLLWSMAVSGKGQDYKPDRWYFPEGTEFNVVLSERIPDSAAPQALPSAIGSMWLLTYLGGIGSRSHRCAGSLKVQHIIGDAINLSFAEVASQEELQMFLQQGLQAIRTLYASQLQRLKRQDSTMSLTHAPFDSLLLPRVGDLSSSSHTCRIWILTQNTGSPWQSLKDAMNTIGTRLKEHRSSLEPQERATFGLPLNINLPDRDLEKALKDNRRASPLLLRITKLHRGGYVGVAVLFKTPAPSIIHPNNKRILIPAPDFTLIEKWITTAFPRALEVLL